MRSIAVWPWFLYFIFDSDQNSNSVLQRQYVGENPFQIVENCNRLFRKIWILIFVIVTFQGFEYFYDKIRMACAIKTEYYNAVIVL